MVYVQVCQSIQEFIHHLFRNPRSPRFDIQIQIVEKRTEKSTQKDD